MEEPVLPAVAEDPGCPEATGRAGTHMNGTAQHTEGAETHQADVSQVQHLPLQGHGVQLCIVSYTTLVTARRRAKQNVRS